MVAERKGTADSRTGKGAWGFKWKSVWIVNVLSILTAKYAPIGRTKIKRGLNYSRRALGCE